MKVIDLLNKIAKGEKVPKQIKYNGNLYFYCKPCQIYEISEANKLCGKDLYNTLDNLNDELEIIEEEKEIEELNLMLPICNDIKNAELGGFASIYKSNLINIKYKIDEIIDELNKIKKEGK